MSEQRIQAGTYVGRGIAGSEQYGTTSNGNDQIVVNLMLTDIGEEVSTFLVFSEKAAPYSIERLRAMGWKGNDLSKLDGIDENEVQVSIAYEQYNGETKMKVNVITSSGRVVLKNQMDEKAKRMFAAKFATLAGGTPGAAPTGKQQTVGF